MSSIRYLIAILIFPFIVALSACGGGDGETPPPPPPPASPQVISVSPSQSSDTALVTTVVTAQFSEKIDSSTIDVNSFTLHDSGMNQISGRVEYKGTYDGHDYVAVFTPADPNDLAITKDLNSGESYTARVTTAVTDIDNNSLANDYVWSFQIESVLVAVSTDSADAFGNSDSTSSAVDETGEFIVFTSENTLLPDFPTGGTAQVYRKNTISGKVEIVSTTSDNQTIANGPCSTPRISDTGRFVVFASKATNLDPSISNPGGLSHIYRKDVRDGLINLLDVVHNDDNAAANGNSTQPDVSAQGNFVAFESAATNLVDNDTNGLTDIFIVNPSGTIERVSVATSGEESKNGNSYNPRISSDGQRLVFQSEASDLVAGDSGGHVDILYRDRNAITTSLISVDSNEVQANGDSTNADISADGNSAVFQSAATNLVSLDGNSKIDIFLRDLDNTITTRISVDANGADVDGDSTFPSISADGLYVAFESTATKLITPDTNGALADIFVRQANTQSSIVRVSMDNLDTQGNAASRRPAISANGRYVSFTTPNKFNNDDGNGVEDIYRAYNAALP